MYSAKFINRFFILAAVLVACVGFTACDDDDNNAPTAKVYWHIHLNSKLENPGVPNRTETGLLEMVLYSDNSLAYQFSVYNLSSGDALTMAHIHAGDPITNGPVVLNFNPTFNGTTASGTLLLTQSFADSLLNSEVELYFNVHSQQVPAGLLRGQVNSDILLAADVPLSGNNEVPPIQTTATGVGSLRLATNKKLYSKVSVANLESNDNWTMSHIHRGAAGVNGPVLVPLCASAADFGVEKITTLTDDMIHTLLSDSLYVNAHSSLHGPGLIRGQVHNEAIGPHSH